MHETKDINTGYNYCKCGCYLYSEEESRIKFKRNVEVIYSKYSKKFICICPKCNATNFVCKD